MVQLPAPDKPRPAIILTRTNMIPRLHHVTVAPITSTIRGAPSEVLLDVDDGMKGPCAANFHNVATVPKSSVGRWVSQLRAERLAGVCAALRFALGCD